MTHSEQLRGWNDLIPLTSSANILYFFYPEIDIKKNSKVIRPNAPKFHFWYNQLQKLHVKLFMTHE
jgi:hypothetical protein